MCVCVCEILNVSLWRRNERLSNIPAPIFYFLHATGNILFVPLPLCGRPKIRGQMGRVCPEGLDAGLFYLKHLRPKATSGLSPLLLFSLFLNDHITNELDY